MKEVKQGIILILSCQKHMNTRLKKFKLSKNEYLNWKVIYVIGDLTQEIPYLLKDDNMLYIKCEDSYIHLLKKLSLSIKYINEIFNIKEGILRCGDDLIFNESKLIEFLKKEEKYDYWGYNPTMRNILPNEKKLKRIKKDTFMLEYYKNHSEDFLNPNHGLQNLSIEKLKKYLVRPNIFGAAGTVYYISKKSSDIIINELEKINFNIFHFDEFSRSYPYIIEDVAIAYMMFRNNIEFINSKIFVDFPESICMHTNLFK